MPSETDLPDERRKLTAFQAARPARYYQPPAGSGQEGVLKLAKTVSAACDAFFRRRGMDPDASWR